MRQTQRDFSRLESKRSPNRSTKCQVIRPLQKIVGACFIIIICQSLFTITAQTEPADVVRIDSNLVTVFFSGVDKNQAFITTLERGDVKLFENGIEQQILTFQRETERPLSIALLIDISGSQKNTLALEKAAAKSFTDAVLRRPGDQLAVISFAADPFLEQELTTKLTDVEKAIDAVSTIKGYLGYQGSGILLPVGAKRAEGSLSYTSAIWDALWLTCKSVLSAVPVDKRRVIVILTDGEDTSSRASIEEAITQVSQTNAIVYVIGIGDSALAEGVNRKTLGKLARETGGKFFSPKRDEDLKNAFRGIEKELRSQYLMTYVPENRDANLSYRHLRIQISNRKFREQGIQLFHRPGYYLNAKTGASMSVP